jgi:O-antigen polysaccharide polymerase Wzy
MNSFATNGLDSRTGSSYLAATLEILVCLISLAMATILWVPGWLSSEQAACLALCLLLGLIGLSWKHFGGGCHPCFYFLCLLTLFQAGRILAYVAGAEREIFRITLMTATPFDVPRRVAATVLAAITLSALVIYAVCRWNYRPLSPLYRGTYARFRPYFYWLFFLSLPLQLYRNYCYYAYARDHGGYLVFFIGHGGMAASVPLAVRAVSLVSLPSLVGIFVLEQRRDLVRLAAALYFAVAAPVLLTGSRGSVFTLILSLCYLSQAKTAKRVRPFALGLIASALFLVGTLVGSLRVADDDTGVVAGAAQFIADQGASLNVTEVAVLYRDRFVPHIGSYVTSELQSAFVAVDQANSRPGMRFSDDVAGFLNPVAYHLGFGGGSAYVAEAYVLGGIAGVVLVSIGVGFLLHVIHAASRSPLGLFLAGMILPDLLWMPRSGLLDWMSAALRGACSIVLLAIGWFFYRALRRIGEVLWQERVPGEIQPCATRMSL